MGKPLRVLQIMGIVESGGVEAVIMNYYRNIDKSKLQFDFVMHKGGNPRYITEAQSMGAKVYEITPYNKNILAFTHEIYKVIKDGHYDIIHSNMNSLSGFPLFAAWLADARVRILHNHTTDTKAEGFRTVIKRALRPFAKMFANQYWACSKLAAVWMYGKQAVNSGKVTIINNAVDLDKFAFSQEKRDALRKELGLEGKFVVGHVGRFMKQKNQEFLIDIFTDIVKQRENAVLLLVGDGPLMGAIRDKVNNLHLKNRVLFLGVRNDVADLYNVMDVFVLPSFYEGLPVVGIEAQAMDLPCFFSDSITNEIAISKNVFFISLKISPKEWALRILNTKKTHASQNKQIIQNSGFDIKKESKQLMKYYTDLKTRVL